METKVSRFVDGNQNIVIRTDTIYSPQEFLSANHEVFNFAESLGMTRQLQQGCNGTTEEMMEEKA